MSPPDLTTAWQRSIVSAILLLVAIGSQPVPASAQIFPGLLPSPPPTFPPFNIVLPTPTPPPTGRLTRPTRSPTRPPTRLPTQPPTWPLGPSPTAPGQESSVFHIIPPYIAGACYLTQRLSDFPLNDIGWCVTTRNFYSNNEVCTVQVSAPGRIYSPLGARQYVPMFDTEDRHDYITLNAERYSGNGGALSSPGINVEARGIRFNFDRPLSIAAMFGVPCPREC